MPNLSKEVVRVGLLVGISALGFFAVRGPLESPRPFVELPEARPVVQHEDVEARLWQDPFIPVAEHEDQMRSKGMDGSHHGIGHLSSQISDRAVDNVRIVTVMVPGAPYPEDVERRKRSRYAVVAALHQQGYVPVRNRHIGYVRLDGFPTLTPAREMQAEDSCAVESEVNNGNARSHPWGLDLHKWLPDPATRNDSTSDHAKSEKEHSGNAHSHDQVLLPYEWFEHSADPSTGDDVESPNDSGAGDRLVLVLWLAEGAASRRLTSDERQVFVESEEGSSDDNGNVSLPPRHMPLTRLSQLLGKLVDGAPNPEKLKVRFIGPASSTTLRLMARESKWYRERQHQGHSVPSLPVCSLANLHARFYSPWSTTDEYLIGLEDRPNIAPPCITNQLYIKNDRKLENITLTRTIHTDTLVLKAVIEELGRRNVNVSNPNHHIVLFSESDTHFGRKLPKTFKSLVAAYQGGNFDDQEFGKAMRQMRRDASRYEKPRNIHRWTYLRGIDGRLPHSGRDADAWKEHDGQRVGLQEGAYFRPAQPPAGRGQLDYLERQADALKVFDRELRDWKLWRRGSNTPSGSIRAIGILGSDVYDKMLVINALRAKFPDPVFFTTDMDAIYDDPVEKSSLQNLIIGSTFGLRFDPSKQDPILPFRNTYQASVNLATRMALLRDNNNPERLWNAPRNVPPDTWLGDPRLFEIGIRGHVDLTPISNGGEGQLHPPRSDSVWRFVQVGSGFLIATLGVLLIMRMVGNNVFLEMFSLQRIRNRSPLLEPFVVLLSVLLFSTIVVVLFGLLAGLWLLFLPWDGTGKPLFFWRGVSTWFSDIIHLVAVLTAAALSIRCVKTMFAIWQDVDRSAPEAVRGPLREGRIWNLVNHSVGRDPTSPHRDWMKAVATDGWDALRQFFGFGFRFREVSLLGFERWRRIDSGQRTDHMLDAVWRAWLVRCAFWTVLLVGTFLFVDWLFQPGGRSLQVPQRGDWGGITCLLWLLGVTGTTFLAVCVSVIMVRSGGFATELLNERIEKLKSSPLVQPATDSTDPAGEAIADLKVIRDVTEPIVGLVIYPLFGLALLAAARLPLFDGWGWPPLLIGYLVSLAVIPVCASASLHVVANGRKSQIIEQMKESSSVEEAAINQVEKIDGGAFQSLWQDPLVESILFAFALVVGVLMMVNWGPTL